MRNPRRSSTRTASSIFCIARRIKPSFPLETHKETPDVGAIVDLARRYHLQAGDAIYFDLAYASELPIATLDGGLRTAAKAHGVKLFAA